MKLTQEKLNVVANTNHKTTSFAIKASAQAMQHLSSTLYTHKIRAVIRELCCNAFDSHVAAGKKEVPFAVYAPTSLEPEFVVEDFGTGMSDKDVEKLYTTYFESTKSDSDDFTGALGLGSKSPFCYTDQFTIESRYNGHKSIYTAFYNEDRMPQLTKMVSVKTDEPNGMTIKMAVKHIDISSFCSEMITVLKYFEVIPTVHRCGYTPITSYLTKSKTESDVQAIFKNFCYFEDEQSTSGKIVRGKIVQGNVCYNLPDFKYDSEIYEGLKGTIYSNFGDIYAFYNWIRHIIFTVPLGTVSFSINRESLSLDKRTIENLVNLIKECINCHKNYFLQQWNSKKTSWDKFEYCKNGSCGSRYFSHLVKFKYRDGFIISNYRKNKKLFKERFDFYTKSNTRTERNPNSYSVGGSYRLSNVILCTTKKEVQRMRHYMRTTNREGLIVLYPHFDKKIKQLLSNKMLGYSKFINSEDIEYQYTLTRKSSDVKKSRVNEWCLNFDWEWDWSLSLSKRLPYNPIDTYDFYLKVSGNQLDQSYGIDKNGLFNLISAFRKLLKSKRVLLCNSKSKLYKENKDFVYYLFSEYNKAVRHAVNNEIVEEELISIKKNLPILSELKSKDSNILLLQQLLKDTKKDINFTFLKCFSNRIVFLNQDIVKKYKLKQVDSIYISKEPYVKALSEVCHNYPLLTTYGQGIDIKEYQEYVDYKYHKINGGKNE